VYEGLRYLWEKGVDLVFEQKTFRFLETYKPFHSWLHAQPNVHKRIFFYHQNDKSIDLVMTFGGDGLMLHCNKLFNFAPIPPVMSFDFGSLGFLTPFQFDEFQTEVKEVFCFFFFYSDAHFYARSTEFSKEI
jgi:NAD kinase